MIRVERNASYQYSIAREKSNSFFAKKTVLRPNLFPMVEMRFDPWENADGEFPVPGTVRQPNRYESSDPVIAGHPRLILRGTAVYYWKNGLLFKLSSEYGEKASERSK
jgi:hypothetical protein